jgi:hypothetical protein
MLLPPRSGFTAARGGPADHGRRRSVQVVAVGPSRSRSSHQALDSGTVSSLAMKPTMDPVKLAAKEPLVPGPSPGPSWGRETAVNSGQSRCPADNDIGRSTAVIRRHRPAGPYTACGFKSPQLHQAQRITHTLPQRRLPAICQQMTHSGRRRTPRHQCCWSRAASAVARTTIRRSSTAATTRAAVSGVVWR